MLVDMVYAHRDDLLVVLAGYNESSARYRGDIGEMWGRYGGIPPRGDCGSLDTTSQVRHPPTPTLPLPLPLPRTLTLARTLTLSLARTPTPTSGGPLCCQRRPLLALPAQG